MKKELKQNYEFSLLDDALTHKKLQFNYKKNKAQDHTELLDKSAERFNFEECRDQYWNPKKFSLLYGTPLWEQASESEKIKLNQLFWVAYYSQIISAEIATIFFNQTAAAGLFGIEDFRLVCETLDFESMQERAHIDAFKKISEEVELDLFGERIFTFSMRPYFFETMIFQNTNLIKRFWKRLQLQTFGLLSSGNAFIACQYLTVRGLRTLNGKIIQHQLSEFFTSMTEDEKLKAPVPSAVSYYHFMDESYHFNSSNIIGTDLLKLLKGPSKFERFVAQLGIRGTLKDHANFSTMVNGIFWYDPATFQAAYKVMRSKVFNMGHDDALHMLGRCFCEENDGIHESFKTHQVALESYKNYLAGIDYLDEFTLDGGKMKEVSVDKYIKQNKNEFRSFKKKAA